MKPIVALPFSHQATLICSEARALLEEAGFQLVCNTTGRKPTREELKELISGAYAIVAGTEKYDEEILDACPELKVIVRFGVGTDNFDLEAMKRRGIRVGVIANYNAVAEFALTLMLCAMKSLPRHDSVVRQGKWSRFPMRELTGKTVGLMGFGRIGRRLAELLSGFGVTILAYDPYMNEEAAAERKVTPVTAEELLRRSDIVSLHLPSTPETRHFINADTLAMMKEGAYLINTARGALVDEAALLEALRSGHLCGAGLDVFETEPVAEGNPLFLLENNVLAPHVSAATYETNYNGGLTSALSIINVLQGGDVVYPLW